MTEKEITDIFSCSGRRSRPELLHDILNELQYTGRKLHIINNIIIWNSNLKPMLKMLMNGGYAMKEQKRYMEYSLTEKGYDLMLELREITAWLR